MDFRHRQRSDFPVEITRRRFASIARVQGGQIICFHYRDTLSHVSSARLVVLSAANVETTNALRFCRKNIEIVHLYFFAVTSETVVFSYGSTSNTFPTVMTGRGANDIPYGRTVIQCLAKVLSSRRDMS